MFLKNEGCSCHISMYDDLVLGSLITSSSHRGKGYAGLLLLAAKKLAKRKNKAIVLFIGPFADRPMNEEQLARFYNKHGFSFHRESYGTIWLKYRPSNEMPKS